MKLLCANIVNYKNLPFVFTSNLFSNAPLNQKFNIKNVSNISMKQIHLFLPLCLVLLALLGSCNKKIDCPAYGKNIEVKKEFRS